MVFSKCLESVIIAKDFLFDGWYDEIKDKLDELPYENELSKFKISFNLMRKSLS